MCLGITLGGARGRNLDITESLPGLTLTPSGRWQPAKLSGTALSGVDHPLKVEGPSRLKPEFTVTRAAGY